MPIFLLIKVKKIKNTKITLGAEFMKITNPHLINADRGPRLLKADSSPHLLSADSIFFLQI
jgi:hypothetical protein